MYYYCYYNFVVVAAAICVLATAASTATAECVDLDENCDTWASEGECERNISGMTEHCPKSCGKCPCVDLDENCEMWASQGECEKNSSGMADHCPKACDKCPCVDLDENCELWASQGECEKNPSGMLDYCPKACGKCPCVNADENCDLWASRGECDRNPIGMKDHCPKACFLCPPTEPEEECIDHHESCNSWAVADECNTNPDYMRAKCPKSCFRCPQPVDPTLLEFGPERVVLEIENFGTITMGFYPNAAPVTVEHILKLVRMGCYDSNLIFRVDKGFVAQIQMVHEDYTLNQSLSEECKLEASKTVPAEFTNIRHVRGILSMGRYDHDVNSGGSSFSMLLGNAPHLNELYTVFGKLLSGDDVLSKIEQVETYTDGIFVKPKERITITRATVIPAPSKRTEVEIDVEL